MKKIYTPLFFVLILLLVACSREGNTIVQETDSDFPEVKIQTEKEKTEHYSYQIRYPIINSKQIDAYLKKCLEKQKKAFLGNIEDREFSELMIDYKITYFTDSYLSLHLSSFVSFDGDEAHPEDIYLNFDMQQQQPVALDKILKDKKSLILLSELAKEQLYTKQIDEADRAALLAGIEPILDNYRNFLLMKDHLVISFANGPTYWDSELPYSVALPYDQLGNILEKSLLETLNNTVIPEEELVGSLTGEKNPGLDPDKKYIALTFDDGPHKMNTPAILDALKKYNAKATFYVIGQRAADASEIVKAAYDAGHEIGIHTWTHPNLAKLPKEDILTEVTDTAELITSITGTAPKTIRPPYGAYNSMVQSLIDVPIVNWSVDTLDWKHRNTSRVIEIVRNNVKNGSIILMHDIYGTSAAAVETIVSELVSEGYEFVTVSELLEIGEPSEFAGTVLTHRSSSQ
ncbi:MAG: polysaccharide deacetylase family protein [Bacillus sp. (in: firmicutes)]